MRAASRLALYLAGCLLVGLVLLRATSLSSVAAQASVTTSLLDSPLAKFAKLMPVFAHPRCVNCHGVVNPFDGTNHLTDMTDAEARPLLNSNGDHILGINDPCIVCHTATKMWHLAPARMAFKGRTTLELCRQLKTQMVTSDALIGHLRIDPLIPHAFAGRKGVPSEPADFPPMGRTVFLQRAEEWLKGHRDIPCSDWVGTVTQVETIYLTEINNRGASSGLNVEGDIVETRAATRTMTITFNGNGGPAVTTISMDGAIRTAGSVTFRDPRGPSCTLSTTSANIFTSRTTGDAGEATLTLGFGGSYTLEITGPPEVSEARDGETTTHCTAGTLSESGDPESFEHTPWTVSIAAVLPDPRRPDELTGTITETVTDADPRLTSSWFLRRSPGLGGDYPKSDGTLAPVPVEVTTKWDLKRVP